jgi:IS30 family transposase
VLEIRELIRRLQLDETDRQIARDLQVSRKTVSKYRRWAQQHDVLTAPLPDAAALQAQLKATLPVSTPPTVPSKVTPFRDQVVSLRQRGVECRAIYDILREQHAFAGSDGSVYRFVRHLEPRTPEAFVRVETAQRRKRKWTLATRVCCAIRTARQGRGRHTEDRAVPLRHSGP